MTSAAERLRSLAKGPVYDAYWRFAAERQAIYLKRLVGAQKPWTQDPVLRAHRFTNVFRASDRVSQFLIRRVIYRDDLPDDPAEVFYRVLLFKLFNKIETWEALENVAGPLAWRAHDGARLDRACEAILARGGRLYSAAYIMPSGTSSFGHARKHKNHLALIEKMMKEDLPKRIQDAPGMAEVCALLRAQPTIGDFLAYQLATDLNYSSLTNFSEMEFTLPGPGARDGLRKCFGDADVEEAHLIQLVAEAQAEEFAARDLAFDGLFGRPLQLIDCQNLFCEVDKYARVVHPEAAGHSGRTKIKQSYREHPDPMPSPWFPPKWGLERRIKETLGTTTRTAPAQGALPF